jgi:hypothetical protein
VWWWCGRRPVVALLLCMLVIAAFLFAKNTFGADYSKTKAVFEPAEFVLSDADRPAKDDAVWQTDGSW